MTLEEKLFACWQIDEAKLAAYGFARCGDVLVLAVALPEEGLRIILEYGGAAGPALRGRVVDAALGEEYVNYRLDTAQGFSAGVRKKFTDLLLDVRQHCAENMYFPFPQARRVNRRMAEAYGVLPEFPWARYPALAVYWRSGTKKWFALMGSVARCKVDRTAPAGQEADFINLKADPAAVPTLHGRPGIYPAWHMNKKHWITVILDGTLPDEELFALIDASCRSV